MSTEGFVLFVLDLVGTFAFALNGALTAMRTVRVDIVGVMVLGLVTAVGGGIIRDVLLDRLPPSTFLDGRYLAAAAIGAFVAFVMGRNLDHVARPIIVFDAVGLSVFAATGATTAVLAGAGPAQSIILGTVTAVGGGTVRDVLIGRVPSILSSGFYAIPAAAGASTQVALLAVGVDGWPSAAIASAVCFGLRMLGLRFRFHAPVSPRNPEESGRS